MPGAENGRQARKKIAMTDDPQKKTPRKPQYLALLDEVFDALYPRSLDDLVQTSRDRIQLGLATAEEIAGRAATIEPGPSVDTIDQWRLVAVRGFRSSPRAEREIEFSRLTLLGTAVQARGTCATPEVMQIDLACGLVRTQNSLYRLGVQGKGEPPVEHLRCLAAATHSWGWGESIGAPQFIY
jgi:hypothetical protein